MAKSLVHQAAGVDQLDYHLDDELVSLARIADGADFAEGLEAFFAKRSPEFGGGLGAGDGPAAGGEPPGRRAHAESARDEPPGEGGRP